jgi:integrase
MAGQIINRGKNKWLVRVYLGEDQDGKRQFHNKTINGAKKEAQAYLNSKLVEKYTTGTVLQPSTQALGKYLDEWLETSAKPRLRERTLKSYENVLNLYIRPDLENIKLCELSPVKIQSTYNKLTERVSARTVRYAHAVLRSALNQAVKWQLLPKNPALLVDLPRQKKAEVSVLTPEQAKVFLEAAKESRWYSLFSLMLNAGTRPGEALGLKWSD